MNMRKFDIKNIIDAIEIKLKEQKPPYGTGFFFVLDKIYYDTRVTSFDRSKKLFIRTYDILYSEDVLMIDITVDDNIELMYVEDVQSSGQRDGTLPIGASEEEFMQHQFVDDTFGIDFETYQGIMRIYHLYEDFLRGR